MSRIYNSEKIWLTIDVEELTDTNFNISYKKHPDLNYENLITRWLDFCKKNNTKSTAFVLGSFARKYPKLIKEIYKQGHEIACHGEDHRLVNTYSQKDWFKNTKKAKEYLEDLIGEKIQGYRSPSWSLPFEESYYKDLEKLGFSYSSSYFPFKTYMYGQAKDKKKPFKVGNITEIPVPKLFIPFSGGFYLRVLPLFLQKVLFKFLKRKTKPVIYIHPYELTETNPFFEYKKVAKYTKDYFLAFFSTASVLKKIKKLS